jgi:putative pyruvate formate lyase activating enzyme
MTMRDRSIPAEVHGGGRFLLRRRDFFPAYLKAHEEGRLRDKVEEALAHLGPSCRACPRLCKGVDRLTDQYGVCKVGRHARVASAFAHFGEEDVLRGWRGSGTIFFSWCNLRCVFCFHPDTFVPTSSGLVRIADLFNEGLDEQLLGEGKVRFFVRQMRTVTREGQWAPVTKAFCRPFVGDLVRIKPFSCPPLLLTPNHEVFVSSKKDPWRTVKVRADAVSADDYLLVARRAPAGLSVDVDLHSLLAGEAGRFRKRERRQPAGHLGSLFTAAATSAELAEATGYHPAYVRKLRGQWRRGVLAGEGGWSSNDLLEENGLVRFKTEGRPGIPARIALDERLAWLLGIYCAEGHVYSAKDRPNSHRLVFSFGPHEGALVERTARLLQELFGVCAAVVHRRTATAVEVYKASLALAFARLCGRGSHSKRVPGLVAQVTPEVVQAFLLGVQAGDGCDRGRHIAVNTVSETFAAGLFEVGLLLGCLPSFHRWRPAPTKVIEGREVKQSILYYIKFPAINEQTGKRRSRWKETESHYLVPVHRIDRVPYEGPVYNLEVGDPDHSYLAPFVAVSNCQNFETSQLGEGEELDARGLAGLMLSLQKQGCHNINFVTPEHVAPQIVEALPHAIGMGLRLPLVYNTSAYDSLDSLRVLEGLVDLYMPDFKLWDEAASRLYLSAVHYPQVAREAIGEMHRQVGDLKADEDGLALRGVLVRHLVMPGRLEDTRQIVAWLATLSRDTYLNLMDQYYPAWKVKSNPRFADINRRVTCPEMAQAISLARAAGLWRLDDRWRVLSPWEATAGVEG